MVLNLPFTVIIIPESQFHALTNDKKMNKENYLLDKFNYKLFLDDS